MATSSYLAGSDHMEQRRHADIFFSSGPLSAGPAIVGRAATFPCGSFFRPSCGSVFWATLRMVASAASASAAALEILISFSILLGCWIYVSRGSGGLPPHQPQYGSSGLCCISAGCPLGRRHLRGSRPGSHRGLGSSSAAASCIRSRRGSRRDLQRRRLPPRRLLASPPAIRPSSSVTPPRAAPHSRV